MIVYRWFQLSRHLVFMMLALLIAMPHHVIGQNAVENPICNWQEAATMPEPRFEGQAAVVDDKLYLVGGFYTANIEATRRVDVYDPAADTWTPLADLPLAITHTGVGVDGHTIWIIGGFAGDNPGIAVDTVWKYDIDKNTWAEGPPLPERLAGGTAAILGRDLHYVGGIRPDRDTDSTNHWVLNLDDPRRWHSAAPLLTPRNHLSSVVLDGKWYVIGGQFKHDTDPVDTGVVDVYDPTADTWTPLASLPGRRSHAEAATFAYQGEIVIAGGRDTESDALTLGDAVAYNPQTNRWRSIGYIPIPGLGLVVRPVGGSLVMAGGLNQYGSTPEARTWVAVPGSDNCLTAPLEDPWAEANAPQPPETLDGLTLFANAPVVVNTPVYLQATLARGSGMIFAWDFGDGTELVGDAALTHTYSAPGSYTVTVTAVNREGEQTAAAAVEVTAPPEDAADALFRILTSETEHSSTYDPGSFSLTNESAGDQRITQIEIDLSTALLQDVVFDENGTAGDVVGKPFTPDSDSAVVGLTADEFASPHAGGFEKLTLLFDDFDPGEQFAFSIDIDPASIKGVEAPGPNETGGVSGLELVGTTITVTFDDGSVYTAQTYRRPGSDFGSQTTLRATAAPPVLQILGVDSPPAAVTDAAQIVRVTGTPGARVSVLVTEAGLYLDGVPGGGFEVDAYEANTILHVDEYFAVIGEAGYVELPITLTRTDEHSGINLITAAVKDATGTMSALAPTLILQLISYKE